MSKKSEPYLRRYYYELRKDGHPVATVCIIEGHPDNEQEGMYFRGMSICSPDDNFDRKRGRFIARNRALRAMKGRDCSPYVITSDKAKGVLFSAKYPDGDLFRTIPLFKCGCYLEAHHAPVWERRFIGNEQDKIANRQNNT